MSDLILLAVLAAIVGAAALYVYKAKKSGVKCIGCPAAKNGCCSRSGGGDCCCGTFEEN